MATISSKYLGDLRTESIHLKSGKVLLTDAPVDNNGKGEAFSPTDLLAAALCSCMMTIMGIKAKKEGYNLEGLSAEVIKVMHDAPRKVKAIKIIFEWPQPTVSGPCPAATQRRSPYLSCGIKPGGIAPPGYKL